MNKPKVGDQMYLVNEGNVRYAREPESVTVTKVGRKYISVEGYSSKFVEDHSGDFWLEKIDYTSDWSLYESQQAYEDFKECQRLHKVISNAFGYSGGKKYNLAQLAAVAETLDLS